MEPKAARARVADWLSGLGRGRSQAAQGAAGVAENSQHPARKPGREFALFVGAGEQRSATPASPAGQRSGSPFGRAACGNRRRHRGDGGRSGGDAAVAPHEGGSGLAHCARRYRRRVAGDAGRARADRSRRQRGRCRRPLRARRCRAGRALDAEGQDAAADRQRLYRPRHGQDGRFRTQLLERYRSHRVLRRRGRRRYRRGRSLLPCSCA